MTRCIPFIVLVFVLLIPATLLSQDNTPEQPSDSGNRVEISVNAELVSRYLWRGQNYGQAPSFQPGAEITWRGFAFGTWGAFGIAGDGYPELDFYISKSIGKFTFAVWDYWYYDKDVNTSYFDYRSSSTSHMFEGQIMFSTGEKTRLNLLASSLFYGSDPSRSLYGEAEIERGFGKNELKLTAGYQFKGEYYAPKSAFVNIGCTYTRYLFDFNKYSTYISISLTANPALGKTYLTAAVGF